jgi:hypothetical protein
MIDQVSFPAQQDVQTRSTKPVALLSQLTQTIPDLIVVLWLRLVAVTAPAQSN